MIIESRREGKGDLRSQWWTAERLHGGRLDFNPAGTIIVLPARIMRTTITMTPEDLQRFYPNKASCHQKCSKTRQMTKENLLLVQG